MMIQKICFIVAVLLFGVFLNVSVFHGNGVDTAWAVSERWESAQPGTYSPADDIPAFQADIGTWIIGDTVSEFPECGPTPHTAEILMWDGSRSLQLTSGTTTVGGCADNIWAVLFTELHIAGIIDQSIPISITNSTFISFKESGSLIDPQEHGWGGCIDPPCYDNVSLQVGDNNGNIVTYVLQRYPLATPETRTYYIEIFLNETAQIYQRNLFNDFSMIPDFNPNNATIYSIAFKVDEHGSATIDDIVIGPAVINFSVYDTNQNWEIGDFELLNAIDAWAEDNLGDFELLDLIDYWAFGSYCWDVLTDSYKAGVADESGACIE